MTTKITLAKVTHVTRGPKVTYFQLNKNIELCTSTGSIFDRQIDVHVDTWYWFAFNDAINHIVDMSEAVNGDDLAVNILAKHKNLVDATHAITQTYSQVTSHELTYVLQSFGFVVTSGWAVFSAVQSVNALFAWEPVNLAIGLGMTAVSSVVSAGQIKKLNETQRAVLLATKQFEHALTDFHAVIKAYAPDSMRNYAIASPAFDGIFSKIYRWLPKMDVTSMETNRPNWSWA